MDSGLSAFTSFRPRPGMMRSIAKRPAQEWRTLKSVAPRMVRRLGNPDSAANGERDGVTAGPQLERWRIEGKPVMAVGHGERLTEAAGPCAQKAFVRDLAPPSHQRRAALRRKRPDEHGAGRAFPF